MTITVSANAVYCSARVTNINFDTVALLSGRPSTASGAITFDCKNGWRNEDVLICPGIGAGSGGATAVSRTMVSGKGKLEYNLYMDPSFTQIWGMGSGIFLEGLPTIHMFLDGTGSGSMNIPIYAKIPGGQGAVPSGNYISHFTASYVEFKYRTNYLGSFCNMSMTANTLRPEFNVTANVIKNCLVDVQDIDFGSKGILDSDTDATGLLSVTCTPGTTYAIGLSNGQAGRMAPERKMQKGSESITYGLYLDAERRHPWGDNTMLGQNFTSTGTGKKQLVNVYGRVPRQAAVSSGIYTDTVVVTVSY